MANSLGIDKIKNHVLSIAIVLVALFIAVRVYKAKSKEIVNLKNQKIEEENKNEIFGQISILEKMLGDLKKTLNEGKQIDSILNKIGDMANAASVKITSITPQKESANDAYTRYPYEINFSAQNYHNIGKFISSLESSPDVFIVGDLRINAGAGTSESPVTGSLVLSTIMVNK